MIVENCSQQSKRQAVTVLKKLLGSLELEIMEFMWQSRETTVQQVMKIINGKRPIAYTTVMTVMGRLVDKGLLIRTREGKRFYYQAAQNRNEFLHETVRRVIRTLVDGLGDLAITAFMGEINKVDVDNPVELGGQA